MPGVVISNATRIWETNVHWSVYSQCCIWDARGRGVDIWECIRDRKSPCTPSTPASSDHQPYLQMILNPAQSRPTRHTGDTSRADSGLPFRGVVHWSPSRPSRYALPPPPPSSTYAPSPYYLYAHLGAAWSLPVRAPPLALVQQQYAQYSGTIPLTRDTQGPGSTKHATYLTLGRS